MQERLLGVVNDRPLPTAHCVINALYWVRRELPGWTAALRKAQTQARVAAVASITTLAEMIARRVQALVLPAASGPPERAFDDLVTLDQAAAMVGKSKRTLERYLHEELLPVPGYPGGSGKPHRWRWSKIRPALEKHFRADLPKKFPASRVI